MKMYLCIECQSTEKKVRLRIAGVECLFKDLVARFLWVFSLPDLKIYMAKIFSSDTKDINLLLYYNLDRRIICSNNLDRNFIYFSPFLYLLI